MLDKQGVDLAVARKGVLRVSYRAAAKEPQGRTEGTERCATGIFSLNLAAVLRQ